MLTVLYGIAGNKTTYTNGQTGDKYRITAYLKGPIATLRSD